MKDLFHLAFVTLWALLGSAPALPQLASATWEVDSGWQENRGVWTLSASSSDIPNSCRAHPNDYIRFPMVINASQTISSEIDDIVTFSDPSFQEIRSTYGRPELSCKKVLQTRILHWILRTDSQYFSHFSFYPYLQQGRPLDNVFEETLNVIGFGTMIVFAIFCFIIFSRTVSYKLAVCFASASLSLSAYFAAVVPGLLSLNVSMITSHRFGDAFLCVGFLFIYSILCLQKLLTRREVVIYAICTLFAVTLQVLGTTSDEIQMGTLSIFLPTIVTMMIANFRAVRNVVENVHSRLRWLQLIGLGFFTACFLNDMLIVSDAIDSFLILPLGIVALVMFLALAVQEEIAFTYRERDFLRSNLEKEVERKTAELNKAQAELIHSAKLVSLGTLSAGIAHEINNSINFVNGAIVPLGRLVSKLEGTSPRDHERGKKLLAAISDGVANTVSIVRSLRQFTGLNQSKFNDVRIADVLDSVVTILGSKIREKSSIMIDVEKNVTVYGDVVGINQVFMNLISNSIDAMPNGGTVRVTAGQDDRCTTIEVSDQGHGIAVDILSRVFDPFFTTKMVGAGTGLGLYIIANEMKKHAGSIEIRETGPNGTTIALAFPHNVTQTSEGL